jgi:hypothetical protein
MKIAFFYLAIFPEWGKNINEIFGLLQYFRRIPLQSYQGDCRVALWMIAFQGLAGKRRGRGIGWPVSRKG